jgi:L-alanine-DL-glutamate epimerase-like enolase superfamily enzyme
VKITAIKTLRLNGKRGTSQGLIKIETDSGLVGYGPSYGGPETRMAIAALETGPGGGDGLIGKDPLAIRVHFHNMFYSRAQRPRNVFAYSGIDMALWDLAGSRNFLVAISGTRSCCIPTAPAATSRARKSGAAGPSN